MGGVHWSHRGHVPRVSQRVIRGLGTLYTVHRALCTAPLPYLHAPWPYCHDAVMRYAPLDRRRHTIAHWLWGDQPCSVKLDRRGLDIYSCGE